MIQKRYNKFDIVKRLTLFKKQWYNKFENPSNFLIFIVHLLFLLNSLLCLYWAAPSLSFRLISIRISVNELNSLGSPGNCASPSCEKLTSSIKLDQFMVYLYHVAIPTHVSLLSLSNTSKRRSRAAGLQRMTTVHIAMYLRVLSTAWRASKRALVGAITTIQQQH